MLNTGLTTFNLRLVIVILLIANATIITVAFAAYKITRGKLKVIKPEFHISRVIWGHKQISPWIMPITFPWPISMNQTDAYMFMLHNREKGSVKRGHWRAVLPVLHTLNISHNKLETVEDVQHLTKCPELSVLDLSHNNLQGQDVVQVFADMACLRVLNLMGNPVKSAIRNYRNVLTVQCKTLHHLDDRPVFPRDRACAEAWAVGGYEAAEKVRLEWIENERLKIQRSVEALWNLKEQRKMDKLAEEAVVKEKHDTKDNGNSESASNSSDGESSNISEETVIEASKHDARPASTDIGIEKVELSKLNTSEEFKSNKELSIAEKTNPEAILSVKNDTTKTLIEEVGSNELYTSSEDEYIDAKALIETSQTDNNIDQQSNLEIENYNSTPALQNVGAKKIENLNSEEKVYEIQSHKSVTEKISVDSELLNITLDTNKGDVKRIFSSTRQKTLIFPETFPNKCFLGLTEDHSGDNSSDDESIKNVFDGERKEQRGVSTVLIEEISDSEEIGTVKKHDLIGTFDKVEEKSKSTIQQCTRTLVDSDLLANKESNLKGLEDVEGCNYSEAETGESNLAIKRKMSDQIEDESNPLNPVKVFKVESTKVVTKNISGEGTGGFYFENNVANEAKCGQNKTDDLKPFINGIFQNDCSTNCLTDRSTSSNTLDKDNLERYSVGVKLSDWQKLVCLREANVSNEPCSHENPEITNEIQTKKSVDSCNFSQTTLDITTSTLSLKNLCLFDKNTILCDNNFHELFKKRASSLPDQFADLAETPTQSYSTPNILYDVNSEFGKTNCYEFTSITGTPINQNDFVQCENMIVATNSDSLKTDNTNKSDLQLSTQKENLTKSEIGLEEVTGCETTSLIDEEKVINPEMNDEEKKGNPEIIRYVNSSLELQIASAD